jgi:hypothetical protein
MKRAIVLCVLVAGCSFPEIDAVIPADSAVTTDSDLSDTSGADADDSSLEDASADSTEGDATLVDDGTDAKPDTFVVDSYIPDADAGKCPASVSPGTDPCDCDGDGDKRAGSPCGGHDCDDGDPRANSKVTTFQTYTATSKTNGDWNCDGNPQKENTEGVSCSAIVSLGDCAGKKGFTTVVACGASGTYVTCKVSGLSCVTATSGSLTQGCR